MQNSRCTAYGPRALEEHLAEYADNNKANSDADIVEDEPDIMPNFSYKSEEKIIANEEISSQNQPVSQNDNTERIVREYMLHKRMNEADSEEEEAENNSPYSIPASQKTMVTAKSVTDNSVAENKAIKTVSNNKPAHGTAPVSHKSASPNATRKQGTKPPSKNRKTTNINKAEIVKKKKAQLSNYLANTGNTTKQGDDDYPFDN